MNIVYKYPLRISNTAAETLRQWSCTCRYLWNRTLRLRTGLYKRYKTDMRYTGEHGTNRRLTTLRGRYEWLRTVPNTPQQEILRDMDKAFSAFYRRVKQGQTPGYPRFKRRGDLPRLYFSKQRFSIDIDDQGRHYLNLTKIKAPIRIDVDRPYINHTEDSIVSCSLVYERKYWYICLLVNTPDPVIVKRDLPSVGINRGIVRTVALSDGGDYQIDTVKLKELEQRKAVLQRRLSRKVGSKKGQKKSRHWLDQKKRINKIDTKMSDIRSNFNHQTSRRIVSSYGDIAVEAFDIKKMTKSDKGTVESPGKNVQVKANFNKAMLRNSWGGFVSMLEYKAVWMGSTVNKIDSHYITQQCSECGHVDDKNVNKLTRTFKCTVCDFVEDMDTNAAKNVLHRSTNSPAGSPGCGR